MNPSGQDMATPASAGSHGEPPFTPPLEHVRSRVSDYFNTQPRSGDSMTPINGHLHEPANHAPANTDGTEETRMSSESKVQDQGGHLPEFKLRFKQRIKHFTWTWFTMTMATGGIANVLDRLPYRFQGLYTIGCIFFLFNIVLFIFNVTMITLRFRLHPGTFKSSFLHPTESLFIPAWLISVGTILLNITQYGTADGKTGTWLLKTMNVLFWVYCGLAIVFSCGIYLVMWSTQTFTISQMTPVWIFPAYPLLVVGPHASILASRLPPSQAVDIIVGGVVLQGIGFMVSLMIYAAFIYRLMTQKLPQESLRPGMFISVGPSGFTIAGIIGMGQSLPNVVSKSFMGGNGELAGKVSMILANWVGLWLWGLAIWFFLVSVFAHWSTVRHGRWKFAMTWYSYVFPNTALVTATLAIGKALNIRAIKILGCVMTCILILLWITVFISMIRAVIVKDILWPQKQEDRDEGGWTDPVPLTNAEVDDQSTTQGQASQVDGSPVEEPEMNALSRVMTSWSTRSRRRRERLQYEV